MPTPEKVAVVEELEDRLKGVRAAVLTDYRGLDVGEITELRRQLREAGVEFKVVKNTLTRLAAQKAGIDRLEEYLEGPTAIAFGYDDPVTPAKILADFAKEHNDLELKGGILNGEVIGKERVEELAKLPSREQLLVQVAAGMQAPIAGLVYALNGVLRSLVYALDAIRRQREAEA